MARSQKQQEPREANLSFEQIKAAIPKIERKIAEMKSFDVNKITEAFDPRISTLAGSLETLLASIFGTGTVEFDRYHFGVTHINESGTEAIFHPIPAYQVQDGLRKGIAGSIVHLEEIKKWFLEELQDAGETAAGKTLKAYDGMELHPAIQRAAGKLFRDGHYAHAIVDAVKALNAIVKLNSGVDDKDGTALMEVVFNPKNPVLKFNNLSDDSDKDEQKGFMMMLSGAVAGLRNPRAHKIIQDDPEMALEFIAFISLLAKLVDKSTK